MKGGSIVDVERVKERNKRVAKANAELKKIISYNDESVNKYKLLICASTNAIYTFDTYII